jgi:uncharacterized repeat protein (TIGR01451 family)
MVDPPSGFDPTQIGPTLRWDISQLLVDDPDTIVFTVTVQENVVSGTTILNSVIITGSVLDDSPGNNDFDLSTTVIAEADLGVSKEASPDAVVAGDTLIYTVTFTNAGPSYARWLTITDVLPDGVAFGEEVSAPAFLIGPTPDGQRLTWTADELEPGGPHVIVFTATMESWLTDIITNRVFITSAEPITADSAVVAVTAVPTAPVSVAISGPSTGISGTASTFVATVNATATLPLTYTWEATGRPAQESTDVISLQHSVTFTWVTTGTKYVTVTVTNAWGTVSNTHSITVGNSVTWATPDTSVALEDRTRWYWPFGFMALVGLVAARAWNARPSWPRASA